MSRGASGPYSHIMVRLALLQPFFYSKSAPRAHHGTLMPMRNLGSCASSHSLSLYKLHAKNSLERVCCFVVLYILTPIRATPLIPSRSPHIPHRHPPPWWGRENRLRQSPSEWQVVCLQTAAQLNQLNIINVAADSERDPDRERTVMER